MFDGETYEIAVKNGVMINATMELLTDCNLRCKHCYIETRQKRISFEEAKRILDILQQEGTINLTFTGGEVFLHPEFREIYTYAKKQGYIIEIKTNGLLIDKNWADLFCELPPDEISISVYGLNNEDYSSFSGDAHGFDKLIAALDLLSERNLNFGIHVICNRSNYDQILAGHYKDFFARYGKDFAFDDDLLGGIEGGTYQLHNRLSPLEIMEIETRNDTCIEMMQYRYAEIGNEDFHCVGGINKVFIDASAHIHICLFDNNVSFPVLVEDWKSIKQKLLLRNQKLDGLYQKSICAGCAKEFLCRRCPLKWERVSNWKERCQTAEYRRRFVENSRLFYNGLPQIPAELGFRQLKSSLSFPHLGLRETPIDNASDYFDQIAHYNVLYSVNGQILHGNKGKSFFYIPAIDKDAAKALGVSVGHAIKLLKWIDDPMKTIACFSQYLKVNRILEENKLVPKTYALIAMQLTSDAEAFTEQNLITYKKGDVLYGMEVEHYPITKYKNVFRIDGIEYSMNEIQEAICRKLKQLGIIGKDLWLGNFIGTSSGIKLIDTFDWSLSKETEK